jgi:hypothetical protein
MITVEYLLPFNTEDGICENIDSFKSLLTSNSNFKLKNSKIEFKSSLYNFYVTLNIVEDKDCSVYHVTFEISKLSDKFREMLKAFRKTVGLHLKDNIQIIWDGVSFEWSKELYPRIYQTENSLRKLISKFMLTKLGIGWPKSSIPKDVTESIKKENYKPTHSILYEVDFIQLANFLFKSYSIKDASKLPNILSKAIKDGMDEEKKNEILDYLPKNNWDRYFSDLVEFESGQLKKKWESLYEIRCKVAHNQSMNFDDFELAKNLCEELDEALNKAHKNIDNIEIPEEDKESVGLRTMGVVNEPTSYFVNNYLNLNDSMSSILKAESEKFSFLGNIENPISAIINSSISGEIKLPAELRNDLFTINDYKNDLLSGSTYRNPFNTVINDKIFLSTKNDILSVLKSDSLNLNSSITTPSVYGSGISGNNTNNLDEESKENEDNIENSETK